MWSLETTTPVLQAKCPCRWLLDPSIFRDCGIMVYSVAASVTMFSSLCRLWSR